MRRTRLSITAAVLLALAPAARGEDAGTPQAAPAAHPSPAAPAPPAPAAEAPAAAPASPTEPAAAAAARGIVDRITDEELAEVVRAEGYAPAVIEPRVLRLKIESFTVLMFVAENGRSVQAFAGFRNPAASLETVNAWNRGHRFSRSYLDPDGDPVIELDLDLAGGVTRERLADWLRTVRVSVLAFVKATAADQP